MSVVLTITRGAYVSGAVGWGDWEGGEREGMRWIYHRQGYNYNNV